jgi:hypothetical protein
MPARPSPGNTPAWAGQFAALDDHLYGGEAIAMMGRLYQLYRREAARRSADIVDRIYLANGARSVGQARRPRAMLAAMGVAPAFACCCSVAYLGHTNIRCPCREFAERGR